MSGGTQAVQTEHVFFLDPKNLPIVCVEISFAIGRDADDGT